MTEHIAFYDSAYGNFAERVLAEVRREAFGIDIGQNSWLTTDEYQQFFHWLGLQHHSHVLEIACGSGGPAVYMARTTGCHVIGIDMNEHGVFNANRLAETSGLASRAIFQVADGSHNLPFADATFDSLICIDAMNHLPNRAAVFAEWCRVLKPDGRMLFTDPIIVTGILANEEIAIRSSIGYFLFTPMGENERLMGQSGFELLKAGDVTDNEITVSRKWHEARVKRRSELIQIEGEKTYEGMQRFLSIVYKLSSEHRLSRFVFVARKR